MSQLRINFLFIEKRKYFFFILCAFSNKNETTFLLVLHNKSFGTLYSNLYFALYPEQISMMSNSTYYIYTGIFAKKKKFPFLQNFEI